MSSKQEQVKIVYKTALFVICILLVDAILSNIICYSLRNVGTGELGFQHVIRKKYDIVIFGASKSTTNYNPKIITDVTGLSCYSLGSTGSTFLAQYPQIIRILNAYHPRLVIFEIMGDDLSESLLSYKEGRVVDRMLIHSDLSEINDLLCRIDKWHKIKSIIRTYMYTSVIGDRIVELLRNSNTIYDPNLGFNPKERNPNFIFKGAVKDPANNPGIKPEYKRSQIIEQAFENILIELQMNKVNAVFVHSPNYKNYSSRVDPKVLEMIQDNGYKFIDMAQELSGFDYSEFGNFSDDLHLSPQGADIYSRRFGLFIHSLALSN